MKIGIVGSRHRDELKVWQDILHQMKYAAETAEPHNIDIHVISGGCPTGADHFAEEYAKIHELDITIFRAKWEKHGKKAGPIRNTLIAKESDILIAFPDKNGRGTQDTINKFRKFHPHGELLVL